MFPNTGLIGILCSMDGEGEGEGEGERLPVLALYSLVIQLVQLDPLSVCQHTHPRACIQIETSSSARPHSTTLLG